MTTVQIAVRLPSDQVEAIDQVVGSVHPTRSDVVRRAIKLYLYRLACERDAAIYDDVPLSESELALARDRRAWDTTPAW